jgi:hypothetical protein
VGTRLGDELVATAGPRRHPHLERAAGGLEAHPRERCVARGAFAGGTHRVEERVAAVVGEVLHDDRVVDDREPSARLWSGEPIRHPRRRLSSFERGRHAPGDLDRAAQVAEAAFLVGPHERHERERAVVGRDVDRVRIAPGALGDGDPCVERRTLALVRVAELDR